MDPWKQLRDNISELCLPKTVAFLPEPPDPLTFYREYVSPGRPVIIEGALDHWPAMNKWQDWEYLAEAGGNAKIDIEWTPTGWADSLIEVETDGEDKSWLFVQPETRRDGTLSDFLGHLLGSDHDKKLASAKLDDVKAADDIPYLSHQNDNLRGSIPFLMGDVDSELDFAATALGCPPDAVNLWIGDHRSTSSWHKDHYENLYCVVRGKKVFHLLPPIAVAFMRERSNALCGSYVHETNLSKHEVTFDKVIPSPAKASWSIAIRDMNERTTWIDPEVLDSEAAAHLSPLVCEVQAGQVLYLPAMYYHQVTQTEPTVAVNYWHDMAFDSRFVYYSFLRSLRSQQTVL